MSTTAELFPFQKTQFAFAQCIRDPQHTACPSDVEPRRMAIYQELLYNNVEGFIAHCFPKVRELYADEQWHALIRDYFCQHRAITPMFLEMPREFLKFLQNERTPQPDDPLFLYELAHFEWRELALDLAPQEIDLNGVNESADLLQGIPVVSPLLFVDEYHFPVHLISPELVPTQADAQLTYLLRYRDRHDSVHTLEINALTVHLLQQLTENVSLTGLAILENLATQLQHPQPEQIIRFGAQLLEDLRARDIVLGTLSNGN